LTGRTALLFGERALSYGDLETGADELARRLARFAGAGERVAVIAPNAPAQVLALHAAWRLGGVAVPLSARLREYDLERILSDAEPSAAVVIDSHQGYPLAELMERLELPSLRGGLVVDRRGKVERELAGEGRPAEPLDADTAAILYTSGTTGAPKGALMTHAAVRVLGHSLAGLLGLGQDDRSVLVLPVSHAFGLGCLLATLASGGSGVLLDPTFSLEPVLEAAEEREATVLHGSPALFTGLLKSRPEGLPKLRTGFVGGAPCPPSVLELLDSAGMTVLNVFGMTEIGAATGCRLDDPAHMRHATCGRALPGYELRLSDASELLVRGPYVTPGYFRRPELTAAAFEDGWFRTGDIATIDDDGYLTISGRAKEVVNVGGMNVFPAEVEGFLQTHPEVSQAAVVGVPDERMGEALEAFVVPRPGATLEPADLLRYARPRIAAYKLPYRINLVEALPLLASGKPDRKALAASREKQAVA
jgi:acyl-CoA synthetase (AMP-forming)/AMP-acid ligase II